MCRRIFAGFTTAVAVAALTASTAHAQERPFEISLDGGLSYVMPDVSENITSFTLPFQQARLGYYLSDQVAIEGAAALDYTGQDEASAWELGLAPGLTYHFAPYDPGEARTYISGFGSMAYQSFDTGTVDGSDTQWGLGARVGTKLPMGGMGFVRLEGGYTQVFESDNSESAGVIDVSVGLGAILN